MLFVEKDKNGMQTKRELLCKTLEKVLKEMLPQSEFFAKKTDGSVTSDWVPIARIVV